ncbi:MAG TPA: acyloxyacyl hydrolase [Deltaproteobacteria bacterium]|nr:acyloxyacyl hydrolase [Deltaproteobacteria bacterium]HXK47696.1 acyloxyacyl hydrolase [Deltaproteobacteria bacterium]
MYDRKWIAALVLGLLCCSATAYADSVYLEGGQGFHYSSDSQAVFLCYQMDSSPLWLLNTYYAVALGSWNGPEDNNALILAKGLWIDLDGEVYFTVEPGAAYLGRTTDNLGTRLQFAFRSALGMRVENCDVSIGYKHFSNGKGVFRWTDTPNHGENFITLQIVYLL